MSRGDGQLTVTVVPDSGTDDLTGLTGRFGITIVDKKHLYDSNTARRVTVNTDRCVARAR